MTFRSFRVASSFMIVTRIMCNELKLMVQPTAISSLPAYISLYMPTSLHVNGLVIFRHLRFPGICRIVHAAEELAETAAAFHQLSIFAVWVSRIACAAPTSNLARAICMAWQGRPAGRAGGQQVSAMLNMFAAIPDSAILPGHAQQSSPAFTADMSLGFSSGSCRDPLGGVFAKLGHKGRRTGIRGKDRQSLTGPRHRHIHDAPLLGVLERFLNVWPLTGRIHPFCDSFRPD
jgi:hypothetical protein